MQDPVTDRYGQDKAIVMSIVKYVLIAALLAAAGFVSLKLFWMLIPFIIGFVLAKTSSSLSGSILLMFRRLRHGRESASGLAEPAADAGIPDDSRKPAGEKPAELQTDAAEQPKEKKSALTVLSIIVFALLLLVLIGLIILIAVIGAAQIRALVDKLPKFFSAENINSLLDSFKNLSARIGVILPASAIAAITEELYSLQQLVLKQFPSIASGLLNFILNMMSTLPVFFFLVVVVIVSGYYFLTDKRTVRKFLKRNVPSESFVMNIVQLINRLFTTLFRTIGGYFLLLIITFLLALAALLIIDMPYAVLFALAAAVLDFMPVLGLSATFLPVAVYMAVTGNVFGAVGAVVALATMTIIRRFIEPPILGSALRMHPMATLFSMVLGFGLFGLTGFLLGPVLMVIVSETLTQFHFDRKLRSWFGKLLDKVSDE